MDARAAISVLAIGAALGAGVAAILLVGDDEAVPSPPAATPGVVPASAEPRLELELPLERVERLASLGGKKACAIGGRSLACTSDGGESWQALAELPSRVLAVVAGSGGEILAAASDGTIYAVRVEGQPRPHAIPPLELHVVDAVAEGPRLWLLAHRYDSPKDEMRLPRVVETVLLVLEPEGSLERRGTRPGWGGERLLVEADGAIYTWALYDRRAWRSLDGGRTFRRLDGDERFGANVGGIHVLVERGAERLPGPGRPARPTSTLLVSADGSTWSTAFVTPGDLLVDFADAALGCVVAKGEGAAYLTRDGGRSFHALLRDARLDDAVALAHVDGSFLAALEDGVVLRLAVPEKADVTKDAASR